MEQAGPNRTRCGLVARSAVWVSYERFRAGEKTLILPYPRPAGLWDGSGGRDGHLWQQHTSESPPARRVRGAANHCRVSNKTARAAGTPFPREQGKLFSGAGDSRWSGGVWVG